MESKSVNRRYPMSKKEGFVPAVQRYSATFPANMHSTTVMYLGMQAAELTFEECAAFIDTLKILFSQAPGPMHFDFARYTNPAGEQEVLTVAYWRSPDAFKNWCQISAVQTWWLDPAKRSGRIGYYRESMTTSVSHTETIAFKEYIRGLSACPMSRVKPMGESGYWGAARDRIPASAHDQLKPAHTQTLIRRADDAPSRGAHLSITPPANLTLIRSGVSWNDCAEEQLNSYNINIKPALDAGMDHLRDQPVDSGCCCLRQVQVIDGQAQAMKESWCAGYFVSLGHLEKWAWEHPTHLTIFGRAQKERTKYQDKLELRTYHEVYVIDKGAQFEYINCGPSTGLIPYFPATSA